MLVMRDTINRRSLGGTFEISAMAVPAIVVYIERSAGRSLLAQISGMAERNRSQQQHSGGNERKYLHAEIVAKLA